MVVTEPKVSTDGSLRTSACTATMRRAPRASSTVTTAGKASGMAATARLMAVTAISGGQQDQHHEVFELIRQQSQWTTLDLVLQLGGAVVSYSPLCLRMRQAVSRVHRVLIQQVLHFALMPWGRGRVFNHE